MRRLLALALCGSLVAGCRHTPPEPPPPPPDPACYPAGYHFAFLETATRIFRPGAAVGLIPMVNVAPAGTRALPLSCTSDWSVAGPAKLSADRTRLDIDPEAAPGSVVTVRFRHADKIVAGEFKVIGRDEMVLTGRYSQKSTQGCEAAEKVRELEFYPGNRFAVTFFPFETYQDYWGTYEFDPATGRLRMNVEGGNFTPPGLDLDGQAEPASGTLTLREMFLGSKGGPPPPPGGCTYVF
jgi:hypothetical protein